MLAYVILNHTDRHVREIYDSILFAHKVVVKLGPDSFKFFVVNRFFVLFKFYMVFRLILL